MHGWMHLIKEARGAQGGGCLCVIGIWLATILNRKLAMMDSWSIERCCLAIFYGFHQHFFFFFYHCYCDLHPKKLLLYYVHEFQCSTTELQSMNG